MTTAQCWICGDPGTTRCSICGATMCLADTRYYVDEANIAITRSAKPECSMCHPPTFPRPYSYVRALERGEWEPDWFPIGQEPRVERPE